MLLIEYSNLIVRVFFYCPHLIKWGHSLSKNCINILEMFIAIFSLAFQNIYKGGSR